MSIDRAINEYVVPMVRHAIAVHQANPQADFLDLAAEAVAHQSAVKLVDRAHERVVGGKRSPLANALIATTEILGAAHVARYTQDRIRERRAARNP